MTKNSNMINYLKDHRILWKPKSGYADIVVHGRPDHVEIKRGNDWVISIQ